MERLETSSLFLFAVNFLLPASTQTIASFFIRNEQIFKGQFI